MRFQSVRLTPHLFPVVVASGSLQSLGPRRLKRRIVRKAGEILGIAHVVPFVRSEQSTRACWRSTEAVGTFLVLPSLPLPSVDLQRFSS